MNQNISSENKWCIIGLGFIAQRHIDAIANIGDKLVMACDIDDAKFKKLPAGVKVFRNWEEMMDSPDFLFDVTHVVICTPNYLHYRMANKALERGKKVLCEKPLVINPDHLPYLQNDVYTVLQLRHNPKLKAVRKGLKKKEFHRGVMEILIHRDDPYFKSWKANNDMSGGLLYNIGIHYFDLLIWFFGEPTKSYLIKNTDRKAMGKLLFKNAEIDWFLSIEQPLDNQIRQINLNSNLIDLNSNFENLHTKVYKDIKRGKGITVKEAGKAIQMINKILTNGY